MLDKKQIQKNREEVIKLFRSTNRPGIENLIGWLEGSNFFVSPASTMFHGNFEGGLAAHSYECYKEFDKRLRNYNSKLGNDSAIISSLCHDMCKIDYYIPNVLKSGNLSDSKPYKSDENFPIGHGEKSVILVGKYIELTKPEALIMRWHMSQEDPAWDTYKDKVEKMCPEVILFQNIDKEVSLIRKL